MRSFLEEIYGGLNRPLWIGLSLLGVASIVFWALFPGTVNAFNDSPFMQSYFGKWLFLALILLWIVCIVAAFNSAVAVVIILVRAMRQRR